MGKNKCNIISSNILSCELEIWRKPNKWKSILIWEEITLHGLKHRTSWITCLGAILNHGLSQTLKSMSGC